MSKLYNHTLEKMNWFHKPKIWNVKDNVLTMFPNPKSDFWRKTHYGYSFDNGSFFYDTCNGDFEIIVKITGDYKTQYDQMGIMIRMDKKTWIKAGIEFVNDQMNVSSVVTHDYSDWSMIKLESNPESIWIKAIRKTDAVEIYYSLDNKSYQMMRLAYFPENKACLVGLMAASPKGEGYKALFKEFSLIQL